MSVDARHSPFYAWLNYAAIRELIYSALDLSTGERLMLIKGLVPDLVDDIGEASFESFLDEVRVKARRYAEAVAHPGGVGYAARVGEREPHETGELLGRLRRAVTQRLNVSETSWSRMITIDACTSARRTSTLTTMPFTSARTSCVTRSRATQSATS